MKKFGMVIMAVLTVLVFESCGNNSKNNHRANTSGGEIDTTPEGIAKRDTTPVSANDSNKTDTSFAFHAASGGLTEVELGRIAQKKGLSNVIKNLGAVMVADHSKVNDTLSAIAHKKGILLPNVPSEADQTSIDKLMKLTGKDFDKAYVSEMVDDHENDIKEFEYGSKNCSDPDIRAFAKKTLPVLKKHLDLAKSISIK